MSSQTTQIQRQIEGYVTSGRGYDLDDKNDSISRFKNYDLGVQLKLCSMNQRKKREFFYQFWGFGYMPELAK